MFQVRYSAFELLLLGEVEDVSTGPGLPMAPGANVFLDPHFVQAMYVRNGLNLWFPLPQVCPFL